MARHDLGTGRNLQRTTQPPGEGGGDMHGQAAPGKRTLNGKMIYRFPAPYGHQLKGATKALREVAVFWRLLEKALLEIKGAVSLTDAYRISSAAHVLYAAALLTRHMDLMTSPATALPLTHDQFERMLDRTVKYRSLVEKKLEKLGLDERDNTTIWSMIYSKDGVEVLENMKEVKLLEQVDPVKVLVELEVGAYLGEGI